eukprot:12871656-Alexandrium_andersonii.AAC.1
MPGPPAPPPGPPPAHLRAGSRRSAGPVAVAKAEQVQARPHEDRERADVALPAIDARSRSTACAGRIDVACSRPVPSCRGAVPLSSRHLAHQAI